MKTRFPAGLRTLLAFTVIALLLSACNLPQASPTPGQDAVFTQAAQTVEARLTQAASSSSASSSSSSAPTSTDTPPPTASPVASATNTPIPCNRAQYISDVNYPDNTQVAANATFTKTWRIKNTGSCAWTSGYVLLFENGDRMDAPATVAVTTGTVAPGATVDISVNLKAPAAPGTYRGNFRLRSPENVVFGIGASGMDQFWVQIVVPSPTATSTPTPTSTSTLNPAIILTLGPIITIPPLIILPTP